MSERKLDIVSRAIIMLGIALSVIGAVLLAAGVIVIGWRVAQTEYGGVIVIGCMALVALLLSDR